MVVSLLRSDCLGPCPMYEVELWSDGTVKWSGQEQVATYGTATATVAIGEVDRIVGAFDAAGFFRATMPQAQVRCEGAKCVNWLCGGKDEPTAIVTIVRAGVSYHGAIGACMSELDGAVHLVDAIARDRNWTLATR